MKKTKLKQLFINVVLMFLFYNVSAQKVGADSSGSKRQLVTNEYSRVATTVLFTDLTGNASRFNNMMSITDPNKFKEEKFDDNSLVSNIFKTNAGNSANIDSAISSDLSNSKVSNLILEKVFGVTKDGKFSSEIMQQRGMYSASRDNAMIAATKKIGVEELKNSGYGLISNMYLIVIAPTKVQTMTEYYNEVDEAARKFAANTKTEFKPVKRTDEGYMGSGKAYLYHVRMNDSINMNIYDSYWSEESMKLKPDEYSARYNAFKNANFPIELIRSFDVVGIGTQCIPGASPLCLGTGARKSDDGLLSELAVSFYDEAINKIERKVEAFQVKVRVAEIGPISADVGTKEGLGKSNRYFAYETRENNGGEKYSKRIGAVRVNTVANNSFNASDSVGKVTEKSTFYQYAGGAIQPDMTLRQKPDLGLSAFGGISVAPNGVRGVVGLEYLLTNLFEAGPKELYLKVGASFSSIDNQTTSAFDPVTGDLVETGIFQSSTITINDGAYSGSVFSPVSLIKPADNWTVFIIDGGLEKKFPLARRFYVGLEVGAGIAGASISDKDSKDTYSVGGGIGFHAAPSFGFYLSPGVSLNAFAKFQSFSSFTEGTITRGSDDDKTLYPLQDKEKDIKFSFDESTGNKIADKVKGLSFGAALRLSF